MLTPGQGQGPGYSNSGHEVSEERSYYVSFASAGLPESIGDFSDSLAQFDRELSTKNSYGNSGIKNASRDVNIEKVKHLALQDAVLSRRKSRFHLLEVVLYYFRCQKFSYYPPPIDL